MTTLDKCCNLYAFNRQFSCDRQRGNVENKNVWPFNKLVLCKVDRNCNLNTERKFCLLTLTTRNAFFFIYMYMYTYFSSVWFPVSHEIDSVHVYLQMPTTSWDPRTTYDGRMNASALKLTLSPETSKSSNRSWSSCEKSTKSQKSTILYGGMRNWKEW